jgi:hypothetical protein
MKVQRSIGKKILAVVAGLGLAAGSMVAIAPAASADDHGTYIYVVKAKAEKAGSQTQDPCGVGEDADQLRAAAKAKADCDPAYAFNGFRVTTYPDGGYWQVDSGPNTDLGDLVDGDMANIEPPPCWQAENNCPVNGAIQVAVPEYMVMGVPQSLVVYASWRPDENTAGAPTNGDAVISMDGEPVAAAAFVDGKATFNFTPTEPGLKNVVVSGVLNSNTSGANAWIDSVDGATMVLPYDPELFEEALKNKKVEVGDTYTLEEIAQAKTALGKRLEWRVAQDSKDVCSVVTTKKGEVRAKFTESGKCSIIWTDPKKDEEGKYTFKVTE